MKVVVLPVPHIVVASALGVVLVEQLQVVIAINNDHITAGTDQVYPFRVSPYRISEAPYRVLSDHDIEMEGIEKPPHVVDIGPHELYVHTVRPGVAAGLVEHEVGVVYCDDVMAHLR